MAQWLHRREILKQSMPNPRGAHVEGVRRRSKRSEVKNHRQNSVITIQPNSQAMTNEAVQETGRTF